MEKKVTVNPTTLRRFYLRHKVKYFNVSYTYNQSFKDKVKRDEEIRAFSMKLAEAVAKEELVVYFDSASFNMWIPSNKSWTYYDNPVKLVLNKLRGRGITVMGAISSQFFRKPLLVQTETTNGPLFAQFLERLRKHVPFNKTQRIKLVLDNARAHYTSEVKAAADRFKIDFWYMPPYTPELNSIESLWSVIKRDFKRRLAPRKY